MSLLFSSTIIEEESEIYIGDLSNWVELGIQPRMFDFKHRAFHIVALLPHQQKDFVISLIFAVNIRDRAF